MRSSAAFGTIHCFARYYEVSRLVFPGALEHFTYRIGGDKVVADPDDVKLNSVVLGKAIGKPRLRATARVLPKYRPQQTLVFPASAKQLLLLELLALGAHLSVSDLAALPLPIDQEVENAEADR